MTSSVVDLRRLIKWSRLLIASLLAILFLIITIKTSYFYYSEIRPYYSKVDRILTTAHPESHRLPQSLQTLIAANFDCSERPVTDGLLRPLGCGNPKSEYIAKLIIYDQAPAHESFVDRTLRHLLVTYFIVQPLSESDANTLLNELAYFDSDIRGFYQLSQAYFQKPLEQLSLEQTATLVVIMSRPYLLSYPDKLKSSAHQQQLLKRYQQLSKMAHS